MLLPPGQLSPEWRGLWWSIYPPDELNGLMHLNICMYGVWGCGGVDGLLCGRSACVMLK